MSEEKAWKETILSLFHDYAMMEGEMSMEELHIYTVNVLEAHDILRWLEMHKLNPREWMLNIVRRVTTPAATPEFSSTSPQVAAEMAKIIISHIEGAEHCMANAEEPPEVLSDFDIGDGS